MTAFAPPRLAAGVAVLALGLALVAWRQVPPPARGASAPREVFSAARAAGTLGRLLGDGGPHPVGSAAQAAVRERLAAELRALGLQPAAQAAFACSEAGTCAQVENVLAVRQGREPGPLVLLMAHYDSVPPASGAGDDGAGSAALLEAARVLVAEPPPRRGLALLFTDGEEAGLLGARAFVDEHPLMARVGVVVNLEARGTGGRSLLFQTTGPGNAGLIAAASALPRPAASSLFAAVYERLPNDTDLTPFRRRGVPGLNFAFIGEPRRYHTPRDDLAHLDLRSLQHHGDNLLALARQLLQAAPAQPASPQRVVFFDLLGLWLVRWPERLGPWLASLALVLSLGAGWRGGARPAGLVLALAALAAGVAAAAGLQLGVGLLWRATAPGSRPWVAAATAVEVAVWGSGLLGAAVGGALARWRSSPSERAAGLGVAWAGMALALSWLLPGASYVALLPALAATAAALIAPVAVWAPVLPLAAAVLVIVPLEVALVDSLTLAAAPLSAALAALVASGLWVLLGPRPRVALLAAPPALLWAVAAGVVAVASPDSADRPQGLSLTCVAEAGGPVRLVANPEAAALPAGLAAAAPFAPATEPPFPWTRRPRGFVAAVATEPLPAPAFELLGESRGETGRRVRLRVWSPRGAAALVLAFPVATAPRSLRLAGRSVEGVLERARRRGLSHVAYGCLTVPPSGLELELELGSDPVEAILADRSPGLPRAVQAVAAARPREAVPVHEGDTTLVWRRLRL